MKKITLSIYFLVLVSLLQISCNKEDIQPNKKEGTVEFGFSLKAPMHGGVQKSSSKALAPAPAAVVVSIKKANGNSAYTMQKVDLYNMNGYYISKPLTLLPGDYTVEQFFVVDAAGNVMYASPVKGSPKAYLVSKPLPISFTVSKDVVTKLIPEVLSTTDATPEDFGYTTFSFDVVETFDFLIGVFVYNESTQNFELTTAQLVVDAVGKTIYTDTLAAITNKVTLNDGYDNYFLTVTKDGYKTWTDTLTAAELKLYFRSEDRGPLKVILEKGDNSPQSIRFSIDQTTLELLANFQLFSGTQGANLVVNWGDGVSENIHLASNQYTYVKHTFNRTGVFEVVISGEVGKIIGFILNGKKSVTALDIKSAINLETLILNSNKLIELDVSYNKKLKWLDCSYNSITLIDLSKNNKIETLLLQYNNISSLDLSNQYELKEFGAYSNRFSRIDFSNCNKINFIQLGENPNLSEVIVGVKDSLKTLEIVRCNLRSLNIAGCPNLNRLVCYSNQLDSLNLSNNTYLEEINCAFNSINELNLLNNKDLVNLSCDYNQITTLDLSFCKKIVRIGVQSNPIPLNVINKLFADILAGVIENPRKGIFYSSLNPTGQGLIDKEILKSTYGWEVRP